MKKKILLMIVIFSSLALTACGAGQGATASAAVGAGLSQGAQGATSGGQMSSAMQLAIGTFMLDKTDYPIDATQAATLLTLWKGARSLSTSDTAATEEMNGLVKQIQSSMTAEQLKAIQAMDLKMENLSTISQELGINLGMAGPSGAAPSGSSTQSSNQSPPADFGGGGMPVDGGGGPGGPPGGGSNTTSNGSSGSSSKASSNQGSFMGLSTSLLDQVIKFLETKAQ